jgi:hypothetical protein
MAPPVLKLVGTGGSACVPAVVDDEIALAAGGDVVDEGVAERR